MENFSILSLNAGSSNDCGGLRHIIEIEKPSIVLLQEICLSTERLQALVQGKGYKAMANIDELNKPGTGIVWKSELHVTEVLPLVECRCQSLRLGNLVVFNIYAPSGGNNKAARRLFFGEDIFNFISYFWTNLTNQTFSHNIETKFLTKFKINI